MTTSVLPPFMPDLGADGVAVALERLEDEVRQCGALYGLLIDRTGQIIASDVAKDVFSEHSMEGLAVRLVPIFLASRQISRTFRAWPVRAMLEEGEQTYLFTQPILDQWLLAMAFPTADPPFPPEQLTMRWLACFGPLVPNQRFTTERRTAGKVIARDSISLIFRDDGDDPDQGQDVRGDTQRWR